MKSIFFSLLLITACISGTYAQERHRVSIDDNGENSDNAFTNHPEGKVELQFAYPHNATEMMVSDRQNFKDSEWQPCRPRIKWQFDGKDGYKSIFVKFRHSDGTVSKPVEAHIRLDREPPTKTSLIIDDGAKFTNSQRAAVTLKITAIDAYQMQVSNNREFRNAAWEPFETRDKTWVLDKNDGPAAVFVRFKDLAGNVSDPVVSEILLDRTPPEYPKIAINNNDEFTSERKVILTLSAVGADRMFIGLLEKWVPYAPTYELELPESAEGNVRVEVQFMDEAGNRTDRIGDEIIVDTTPPEDLNMVIASGDRSTKTTNVPIIVSAIGAREMMISNESTFSDAMWKPYSIIIPSWKLTDGEGEKTIYAKFKDRAGNVSDVIEGHILFDATPPANPKISIADNITVTRHPNGLVDLVLSAEDVSYMMVSNDESFQKGSWKAYNETIKSWQVGNPKDDGEKFIFVKYRDRAGNITPTIRCSITLDRVGPLDCKVSVDSKTPYITDKDRKVNLIIFARGAFEMMVAHDANFSNAQWKPYAENYPWQLEDIDGERKIYVKFRDEAGNESSVKTSTGTVPYAQTSIILDRTPPDDCELTIDRGDTVTRNPDKRVYVEAKAHDAVKMMLSERIDFDAGRWETYNERLIQWTFSGGDGNKIVWAKFMDQAGNESRPISASIILDRRPPLKGSVKIAAEDELQKVQHVTITLSAEDASEMMISNFFDFKEAKWQPYRTEAAWTLVGEDGIKTVFVKFRDKIGNESKIAYDRIGLDRVPPGDGMIKINQGAKYCTDLDKMVTLRLYSRDAREMMISNFLDFKEAKWQKYEIFVNDWALAGEDDNKNPKEVFVKFRDQAGNETNPVSARIMLDRQPPVHGELNIDNGALCTNDMSNRVQLSIKADEAKEMMISNEKFFSPSLRWEPFQNSKVWRLSGNQNGKKTVFIKFRDDAGNESDVSLNNIQLDTQAPKPGLMRINEGATITNESVVILEFTAKGADQMWISNSAKFTDGTWEPYSAHKEWTLDYGVGRRVVYVKFKDDCNNEVGPIQQSITVSYE